VSVAVHAWRHHLALRCIQRWRFFAQQQGSQLVGVGEHSDSDPEREDHHHQQQQQQQGVEPSWPHPRAAAQRSSIPANSGRHGQQHQLTPPPPCLASSALAGVPPEVQAAFVAAQRAQRLRARQLQRRGLAVWAHAVQEAADERQRMSKAARRHSRGLVVRSWRAWQRAGGSDEVVVGGGGSALSLDGLPSSTMTTATPLPSPAFAQPVQALTAPAAALSTPAAAAPAAAAAAAAAVPVLPVTTSAASTQTAAPAALPEPQSDVSSPTAPLPAAGEPITLVILPTAAAVNQVDRGSQLSALRALLEVQLPRWEGRRLQRQVFSAW